MAQFRQKAKNHTCARTLSVASSVILTRMTHYHKPTQTNASSPFIYTSKVAARIQVSNLKYFALKGAEQ